MRTFFFPLLLALSGCAGVTFDPDATKIHFYWPATGTVSQGFYGNKISGEWPGMYYDEHDDYKFFGGSGRMHRGVDIVNTQGTAVIAAEGGIARRYDWDQKNNYGNRVVIDHQNGYFTLYAHLIRIIVPDGKQVSKGEHIGDMGTTGNSTGPHLHFEIRHSANADRLDSPHFIPVNANDRVTAGNIIPYYYPAVK